MTIDSQKVAPVVAAANYSVVLLVWLAHSFDTEVAEPLLGLGYLVSLATLLGLAMWIGLRRPFHRSRWMRLLRYLAASLPSLVFCFWWMQSSLVDLQTAAIGLASGSLAFGSFLFVIGKLRCIRLHREGESEQSDSRKQLSIGEAIFGTTAIAEWMAIVKQSTAETALLTAMLDLPLWFAVAWSVIDQGRSLCRWRRLPRTGLRTDLIVQSVILSIGYLFWLSSESPPRNLSSALYLSMECLLGSVITLPLIRTLPLAIRETGVRFIQE